MSCTYADRDGSYVLGALSPAERLDFEQHLAGCADCARSVRELAGLPGLLAQVDVGDLEARTPDAPLPSTLLPALVREVRGQQRRRSVLTAAVAAAVAALFVGALAVGGVFDRSTPPASAASPAASATRSAAPAGQAMVPVGAVPVKAAVALTGVAWGTKLDLTCSYPEGDGDGDDDAQPGATPPAYALVVHTREGAVEQVATWKGLPGKTMRLTGATATGRTDITSVDVRTSDGRVVLTLPV
ncbi:MAG: anti-sigma factor family protein [Ornithinibacter sp.]